MRKLTYNRFWHIDRFWELNNAFQLSNCSHFMWACGRDTQYYKFKNDTIFVCTEMILHGLDFYWDIGHDLEQVWYQCDDSSIWRNSSVWPCNQMAQSILTAMNELSLTDIAVKHSGWTLERVPYFGAGSKVN